MSRVWFWKHSPACFQLQRGGGRFVTRLWDCLIPRTQPTSGITNINPEPRLILVTQGVRSTSLQRR